VRINYLTPLLALMLLSGTAATAATYAELAQRSAPSYVPQQDNAANYGNANAPRYGYAPAYAPNYAPTPPQGYYGMENRYPPSPSNAMSMLPTGNNGAPNQQQLRWSYGQVNAASDAFNAWGLSTQGMYVPWSTPMSAWSNAQQWDWWRNRAGDAGPPPPLW
jgi:hypothetical protein